MAVGRVDVEEMLAEMPAGSLDAWYEYYRLEPWGDDWERSSMTAAAISNEVRSIAAAFGGGKFEAIEADAFVPYRHDLQKAKETEAALAALDAMTGL